RTGKRFQFGPRDTCFLIELPQVSQKLALLVTQPDTGLIAAQLRLLQLAAIRAPIENWNLQTGHGRVAQITHAVGVNGKLVGINAVEVIDAEAGKQSAPRRRNLVVRNRERRQ